MTRSNLKHSPVSGERKPAKTLIIDLSLVGMGFRLKRDVRQALAGNVQKAVELGLDGINVKLAREQENRYDVNAIRVIHDGSGVLRGHHLGYLRADVAAQLAPLIDDGVLACQRAVLKSMDAADDLKTGVLTATFRDKRKVKT